jgi:hypothetical protein
MGKETQKLGAFEIPLSRLFPNAIDDLRKVYDATRGNDDFGSPEVARAWNLKSHDSGGFYRRLNSLLLYGLVESISKGRFIITPLGKDILYPDPSNENHRKQLFTQAALNVQLWKELYSRVQKNPPPNIYSQLKSITGADAPQVQEAENQVRRWYLEDVSLVADEFVQEKQHKSYNLDESNKKSDMSNQSVVPPQPQADSSAFGTVSVNGVGSVTVKDEDSLMAAEVFLNIMKKKVESAKKNLS